VLIGECSLPLRYGAITARAYEQSHALDWCDGEEEEKFAAGEISTWSLVCLAFDIHCERSLRFVMNCFASAVPRLTCILSVLYRVEIELIYSARAL
jgi:hypothetical protein